jgi:hypothetical protein
MITVVFAFLPIIVNPISVDTVNEPGSYNEPRWIDVYGMFMINKESFDQYVLYFRQIDLFSDLSRNTTSSPSSSPSSNDLFESEEDPEIQDNTGSDLEIEGLQDGSTSDVNQTSSPSSNDLFESEKNTEVQSDIETNMKLNSENEVSIQESEANRDNMPNSSLINP